MLGVGAFRVPVFPVGVLYEPPPDAAFQNRASYSTASSIGTTVSSSFFREESTTGSSRSRFDDVNALKETLNAYATGLDKISGAAPPLKAISVAVKKSQVRWGQRARL